MLVVNNFVTFQINRHADHTMNRDAGVKDDAPPLTRKTIERLNKRINRLKCLVGKSKRAEIIRDALLQITHIATEVNSIDEFYAGVHAQLQSLITADNFYIATYDHHSQRLEIPFFADEKDPHPALMYPDEDLHHLLNRGLTGYVFRCGETVLLSGADSQRLETDGTIDLYGSASHQWLGVPIRYQDRTTGVLVVQTYDNSVTYQMTEVELMEFISHHISGVMERLRHHEQLEHAIAQRTKELSKAYDKLQQEVHERRRAERLQKSLFEIAELSATGLRQQNFYARLHTILSQLLPASNCYITLLDSNGQQLEFPFYTSELNVEPPGARPLTDGLTEYLLSQNQPLLLEQDEIQRLIAQGKIYARTPSLNYTHRMHQWIGVPLSIGAEVRGALIIFSLSPSQHFKKQDLELLSFVSQHIGTAIERKQQAEFLKSSYERLEEKVAERTRELELEIQRRRSIEQKLIHDAKHDSLTGLANRNLFTERLGQAVRHVRRHGSDKFALLFIDLDHFKLVNDTLGHLQGDRFLVETAQRLSLCIRENDTLARLGGDEFVILLDKINAPKDAEEVAERILSQLAEPYRLGDSLFRSGASIGIAISGRSHQETADSMLRDADAAMYQAKSRGKGCYVVFDSRQRAEYRAEIQDESLLREALAQNQLYLKALPVESLTSGEIVACQLTLGWHHPTLGELSQVQLHALAYRANLTLELDLCLLKQLPKPLPAPLIGKELHLCLSSSHLKHKHALRVLKNMVNGLDLAPRRLWLFFEEQALVQDTQSHNAAFDALGKLGVCFGLYGYGNGYSSLKSLTLMPIEALRLTANSDEGIEKARLLKASAIAAASLGLTIIAQESDAKEPYHSLKLADICCLQRLQPMNLDNHTNVDCA